MKTMIITTDFSKSAWNAARYAAELAKSINIEQIVLYHSYDSIPVGTDLPVTTGAVPTFAYDESIAELESVQSKLITILGDSSGIAIQLEANDFPLLRGIELLHEKWGAGLVVVGTTGRSNLEQVLMGSNTVNLASSLNLPLLIVPKEADYTPIHKMVFACDLTKVSQNTPINEIDEWLKSLEAGLLVLNVGVEGKRLGPDAIPQQRNMHALLDNLQPEYHFTESTNIAEEIDSFAKSQGAGLIVTIPKSYGFFEGLFRRSVSKQLIKKAATIPILLLREKS